MEVRRSKCGKACLVLGGEGIVWFITQGKTGPARMMQPKAEFYKEWPRVLDTPVGNAVVSYICAAKRAYKYDGVLISYLWEIFMEKCSSDMSLADLLACYNKLALAANQKPRKAFESKAAALTAIEKLDIIIAQSTPQQAAAQTRRTTMSDQDVSEKKPRGKGIGARAKELILEGLDTAAVIATIQEEIEGANPTPATIAWYKNKLRQEGLLPATNRQKKEVVNTETVDPEDGAE